MQSPNLNENMQVTLQKIEVTLEQMLVGKASAPIGQTTDDSLVNRIVELINMLSGNFAEMAAFARALSKGELDVNAPGRRNYLAAPLKELHSQLSSFVWTAQQLECGQVVERLDYMGELSIAMNSLIERVAGGVTVEQDDVKPPVDSWRYHQMLMAFNHLPQMVFIIDEQQDILFANLHAIQHFGKQNRLTPEHGDRSPVEEVLGIQSGPENIFPVYREVFDSMRGIWYKITTDLMTLPRNEIAYLHCIEDISEWKTNESQLRISASIDALTGVYNRAVGMAALETAIASRMRTVFCAAFIDIDKLKYINDNFGHNEGDYAIRTIAGALASSVRDSDTVSRFGGDEFLIVFSGCGIDTAEKVVGCMRARMDEANRLDGKPYKLSFSYGITQIDPAGEITACELIQLMDKKMYERKKAKHAREAQSSGRND